jgi:BlaI family transcriptional regulator, penicillinase repressor
LRGVNLRENGREIGIPVEHEDRGLCVPPAQTRKELVNCALDPGIATSGYPITLLTRSGPSVTTCNATMNNTKKSRNSHIKRLGEVEQAVMDYVWANGPCFSEDCRESLASTRPMKESTIRTVLRRLEQKGYIEHSVNGRTFIYRAAEQRQNVVARAVKNLIDRFCGGSAEEFVIGMVDNQVIDRKQFDRIARKIAQQKEGSS